MSDRWVKLYTRLLKDELWRSLSPGHRCVMLGMLLLAAWEATRKWVPSIRAHAPVPRGALVASQRELAEALALNRKTVRCGLEQLEAAGWLRADEVGRDWRGNPVRRYRVRNYARYQDGHGGGPIADLGADSGGDLGGDLDLPRDGARAGTGGGPIADLGGDRGGVPSYPEGVEVVDTGCVPENPDPPRGTPGAWDAVAERLRKHCLRLDPQRPELQDGGRRGQWGHQMAGTCAEWQLALVRSGQTAERLTAAVEALDATDRYCPGVTGPRDLLAKLPAIIAYGARRREVAVDREQERRDALEARRRARIDADLAESRARRRQAREARQAAEESGMLEGFAELFSRRSGGSDG